MENQAAAVERKKAYGVGKTMLCQYVIYPVVFTAIGLLPLGLLAFISIFDRDASIFDFVYVFIFAAVVGVLASQGPTLNTARGDAKNVYLNCTLLFAAPAFNLLLSLLLYLTAGEFAASLAMKIVNPAFILVNLMSEFCLPYCAVWLMPLLTGIYAAGAAVKMRRVLFSARYKEKANSKGRALDDTAVPKKLYDRIFLPVAAGALALVFAFTAVVTFPDIEYEVLKNRYEKLYFHEEVDFNFYDKVPFRPESELPKLSGTPSLTFGDIASSPNIDGATAFYPMYAAFAENIYTGVGQYVDESYEYYSDIFIDEAAEDTSSPIANKIICTKTNRAYERLTEGGADIIFAFEPSPAQVAEAAAAGVEFELTKIGYDAFCFFVNTKNRVSDISSENIVKVYSGEIDNWRKLGGTNNRIFAFTRPPNSGSQTIMENEVMRGTPISTRYSAAAVQSMGQILLVVDGYLNTPHAIGYTFMFYSSSMVTADSIKYLAIDGIAPTPETVRTGAYRYSVPFYAITRKGEQPPETLSFLDWVTGPEAKELIEKTGYVGLDIQPIKP